MNKEYGDEYDEPMTATEVKIRHLLLNMQEEFKRVIESIDMRVALCERVFGRLMQHEQHLETLEFNSNLPTNPSLHEKLMDMEMRIERLESFLLNGDKQ